MQFVDNDESEAWASADLNQLAVYTKTIAPSPVVRWILHARLRHPCCNDVVYVGDDYIEVRQVEEGGLQSFIARKSDFDASIRAAAIFSNEDDADTTDNFLLKLERDREDESIIPAYPPHSIILTLDSNDLVFLFLHTDDDGTLCFVQQGLPLPSFDNILFQPGAHLAVDAYSRAIATAAHEREVILYSAKQKLTIQDEIKAQPQNWCPVSTQRPLQVSGVILHMDFLIPPADDQDHVVLLLIVADSHKIKAVLMDWYCSSGLTRVQIHPGQALSPAKRLPNLLIPLREASFLLITDGDIVRYKNILSGLAVASVMDLPQPEAPRYSGNSPQAPYWSSWAKPRRSQAARRDKDSIYLVREDGLVYLMTIDTGGNAHSSLAGDLDCHVGSAFASLGDEGDPDILAAAGDTSSGRIVSIGHWPTRRRLEDLSRDETMQFDTKEILPNWASATDMLSTGDFRKSKTMPTEGDHVLVTSGRQPFGAITELRRGIEAQLSVRVPVAGLNNVTDMWTLPNPAMGSIIIVLSLPFTTTLLQVPADFGDEGMEMVDDAAAFDISQRTLVAGFTTNNQLVQVTGQSICLSTALHGNFEDTIRKTIEKPSSILAAAVVADCSVVVIAERHENDFSISCCNLPSPGSDEDIRQRVCMKLESEPLCVAAVSFSDSVVALTATDDGMVALSVFDRSPKTPLVQIESLPASVDDTVVCDSVALLQTPSGVGAKTELLAVCGLRDGNIVTFSIDGHSQQPLRDACVTRLGTSSVKLITLGNDRDRAYALSSGSICSLIWDGMSSRSLSIEHLYMTDRSMPEFSQGPVAACSQLPAATHLSFGYFANLLTMISGEELLVAALAKQPGTVPRRIPVSGTPTRLIYAESIRCMVAASLRTETVPLSQTRASPGESRQICPVIDFIPSKNTEPSFSYMMQPGERVHALLEWSYKNDSDKTYSFVLVGGSYVRHNHSRRGRVTMLQPTIRNWEVASVTENKTFTFDGDVYALALYDEITWVACAGRYVYLNRFNVEARKWERVCEPFLLASPGTKVTIESWQEQSIILITTMRDSIVSLILNEEVGEDEKPELQHVTAGPRAESLLSHYMLTKWYTHTDYDQFTLAASKYGQLIAISRHVDEDEIDAPPKIVFEAQLARSLTRMVESAPPQHRGPVPNGVAHPRIVGCATDGALVGILLIQDEIWKRLSWLQRLVEWSPQLSPHSHMQPPYSATPNNAFDLKGRPVPIGLSTETDGKDIALLYSSNTRRNDLHVDGDVLARVFERRAVNALRHTMKELAGKDHAVGAWLRDHMDEELGALDGIIGIVKDLNRWM